MTAEHVNDHLEDFEDLSNGEKRILVTYFHSNDADEYLNNHALCELQVQRCTHTWLRDVRSNNLYIFTFQEGNFVTFSSESFVKDCHLSADHAAVLPGLAHKFHAQCSDSGFQQTLEEIAAAGIHN